MVSPRVRGADQRLAVLAQRRLLGRGLGAGAGNLLPGGAGVLAACIRSRDSVCGIGGIGRKRRNAFKPKTTKASPSNTRAMMVRIFMSADVDRIALKFKW